MSFSTQERVTVKITYAGDRKPDFHHWAADSTNHPEGVKAMAFYRKALEEKTLEVSKVEIYKETHAYTMRLVERWELEPTRDSEADGTT